MSSDTCPAVANDEIVLKAIDEGLHSLGESSKQALWYYLETEFKLDRNRIHEDLTDFQNILKQFFGSGYTFLDALFCQCLEELADEKFDNKASFVECVNHLYAKHRQK